MARPKGKPPAPKVLEREAEVLKLRRGGLTWDLIAQRTGYANPSSAQKAYERASMRILFDDVDAIRQLENERLDLAQSAIWGKVLQGDNPSISNFLRISERRAKLNGLDQPTRIQAEVVTYDANDIRTTLATIIANTTNSGTALPVAEPASQTEPVTT